MEISSLVTQLSTGSIAIIAGATLVANVVPGIPEELFIVLMGSVVGNTAVQFWLAFIIIYIILMSMDQLLYWSSRGGIALFRRILDGFKKKVFGDSLESRMSFIEKHITKIVVLSRFVFQVRFLGPFLAGTVKMPWKRFTIANGIALAIYIPIMLSVGVYFGDRIERIAAGIGTITNSVTIGVVVILVIIAVYLIQKLFLRWIRTAQDKKANIFGIEKITPEDITRLE